MWDLTDRARRGENREKRGEKLREKKKAQSKRKMREGESKKKKRRSRSRRVSSRANVVPGLRLQQRLQTK
jgi:hypothetical protein